jgi:TonB family protein
VFARSFVFIVTIILLLGHGQLSAAAPTAPNSFATGIHGEVLTKNQMKGVILWRPRIEYPYEARKYGISGVGSFEMKINPKTGRVKGILIVQSTGNHLLDRAVVDALRQWRFKSGIATAFRLPVRFDVRRTGIDWVF